MENRDFKYIMQDVGSLYIGAKMTYAEMLSWEEVPFKWKAIVNRYLMKENNRDETLPETLCKLDDALFDTEVLKQLKFKIKAGAYEEKHGKRIYRSRTYHLAEFRDRAKDANLWEDLYPEEIVISKLALMAIPV